MSDYDWVVAGGGIHGVTIATFLLRAAGVDRNKLLIVDPYVSGALAEMRIGPIARNISAARSAAKEIVSRIRIPSTLIAKFLHLR